MTRRSDPQEGGSTSRSLLADARLADSAAWEKLAALYAPLVAFWCRRWGVREQDLVDLIQEVFSAVAVHLERFQKERSSDSFRGWLLTIARNKVNDYFRNRAKEVAAAGGTEASRRLAEVVDPHAADDSPGPGEEAITNALLHNALEAIRGEFHERTWRAFWGVVIDGRAAADVGADLGMPAGTVRVAKSRVLLRLRRELGEVGK